MSSSSRSSGGGKDPPGNRHKGQSARKRGESVANRPSRASASTGDGSSTESPVTMLHDRTAVAGPMISVPASSAQRSLNAFLELSAGSFSGGMDWETGSRGAYSTVSKMQSRKKKSGGSSKNTGDSRPPTTKKSGKVRREKSKSDSLSTSGSNDQVFDKLDEFLKKSKTSAHRIASDERSRGAYSVMPRLQSTPTTTATTTKKVTRTSHTTTENSPSVPPAAMDAPKSPGKLFRNPMSSMSSKLMAKLHSSTGRLPRVKGSSSKEEIEEEKSRQVSLDPDGVVSRTYSDQGPEEPSAKRPSSGLSSYFGKVPVASNSGQPGDSRSVYTSMTKARESKKSSSSKSQSSSKPAPKEEGDSPSADLPSVKEELLSFLATLPKTKVDKTMSPSSSSRKKSSKSSKSPKKHKSRRRKILDVTEGGEAGERGDSDLEDKEKKRRRKSEKDRGRDRESKSRKSHRKRSKSRSSRKSISSTSHKQRDDGSISSGSDKESKKSSRRPSTSHGGHRKSDRKKSERRKSARHKSDHDSSSKLHSKSSSSRKKSSSSGISSRKSKSEKTESAFDDDVMVASSSKSKSSKTKRKSSKRSKSVDPRRRHSTKAGYEKESIRRSQSVRRSGRDDPSLSPRKRGAEGSPSRSRSLSPLSRKLGVTPKDHYAALLGGAEDKNKSESEKIKAEVKNRSKEWMSKGRMNFDVGEMEKFELSPGDVKSPPPAVDSKTAQDLKPAPLTPEIVSQTPIGATNSSQGEEGFERGAAVPAVSQTSGSATQKSVLAASNVPSSTSPEPKGISAQDGNVPDASNLAGVDFEDEQPDDDESVVDYDEEDIFSFYCWSRAKQDPRRIQKERLLLRESICTTPLYRAFHRFDAN